MIFNSLKFLIFFSIFFLLYWFVFKKSVKLQNLFLLVSSYIFYCFADWRFLAYLIGVSALNYVLAKEIEKENKYSKLLLWIGVGQGVLGLVYFKYFNFFIESFNELFRAIGLNFSLHTLNILMPLGISFFTFRVISYLLDVDKGKIEATKDVVVFFNYVAFFPSILSGPIDKARDLVPQLERPRMFDYIQAVDGMRQILWGLFKKVVIADNSAIFVDKIFENYVSLDGSTLFLGVFFYAFQVYGDFSGYSDMAIGVGRLMGFKVAQNFAHPYFAQNIADFWRRWHMSLTTWLTEYIFTPLSISFRNYGKWGVILAIVLNFVICGIWHGANWTFLVFGFIHGCLFIPLILKGTMNKKKKLAKSKLLPSFKELFNMGTTFFMVMMTFIVFRAENLSHAVNYFRNMFSLSLFSVPSPKAGENPLSIIILICLFIIMEWIGRDKPYAIKFIENFQHKFIRWIMYSFIIFIIGAYMQTVETPFLYFQF